MVDGKCGNQQQPADDNKSIATGRIHELGVLGQGARLDDRVDSYPQLFDAIFVSPWVGRRGRR